MRRSNAVLPALTAAVTAIGLLDFAPAAHADDRPNELSRPTPQVLQRLIKQLGHADYFLRRKAENELIRYRFDAVDALAEAVQSNDAEVASQAQIILDVIRGNWVMPGDPAKVVRVLAELDSPQNENGPQAANDVDPFAGNTSVVDKLIALPEDMGIPAACRLLRFGPSVIGAKQMALSILNLAPSGKPPTRAQADLLQKALTGSNRDAAQWILCWARTLDNPLAMTTDWSRWVSNEERLLARGSNDTSPEIVGALLRLQIAWLRKLDRKQDSIAAFGRLLRLEKDKPDVLETLLSWLIEQEDWNSVETVSQRFGDTIGANAPLLYLLAEARSKHGDRTGAEAAAQRAIGLAPNKDAESLKQHLLIAWALQERGLVEWACRELRYVIANQSITSEIGLRAAVTLGDLLHEDEDEQAAGDALKRVDSAYAAASENTTIFRDLSEEPVTVGNIRARMNYYYACRAAARGDRAEQRKLLEKALAGNAYDIEVLIAAYQLPDSSADFRRNISQRIERSAAKLRERIADNAYDAASARWCNEFAWLVGNTEGDLDEALGYSKSSVEWQPTAGGYYDTLARVYIAKRDFANALQAQTKAVNLTPHNKAIQRQYEMLRKKRD